MSNFHSDEEILREVRRHYKEAQAHISNLNALGIFYYGSANYGLDCNSSDTDTKIITIPSIQDFYCNNAPLSFVYEIENNEHINFSDIRLFFSYFKKQNINFLEILFTKYNIINPDFLYEWELLVSNRENIAHYDTKTAIKATFGNMINSRKRIFTDQNNYCKHLSNIVRYDEFIMRYINGFSYEECLISENLSYLKDIRFNKLYSLEEAIELSDNYLKHSQTMIEEYSCNDDKNKQSVDELLASIQASVIEKSVRKELQC